MSEPALWWLLPLFFVAALLYSSVGHGGGSAYLAIMAFTALPHPTIRSTALVLNIIVATAGFISYHRAKHFQCRLLLPFALFSIPAAYLGGLRLLSQETFSLILGITLALTALRLAFLSRPIEARVHLPTRLLWVAGPLLGAGLGLLAGMVGIGGGIFLSPVLLFLGWADAKKTAAVSAAFIVLNSISGLVAQTTKTKLDWVLIAPLAATVLVAGVVGSRLGANRLAPVWLQRLLAVVLVVASYHLLKKAFG